MASLNRPYSAAWMPVMNSPDGKANCLARFGPMCHAQNAVT